MNDETLMAVVSSIISELDYDLWKEVSGFESPWLHSRRLNEKAGWIPETLESALAAVGVRMGLV